MLLFLPRNGKLIPICSFFATVVKLHRQCFIICGGWSFQNGYVPATGTFYQFNAFRAARIKCREQVIRHARFVVPNQIPFLAIYGNFVWSLKCLMLNPE